MVQMKIVTINIDEGYLDEILARTNETNEAASRRLRRRRVVYAEDEMSEDEVGDEEIPREEIERVPAERPREFSSRSDFIRVAIEYFKSEHIERELGARRMRIITVNLPIDQIKYLEKSGDFGFSSRSEFIRHITLRYVDHLLDQEAAAEASTKPVVITEIINNEETISIPASGGSRMLKVVRRGAQ